MLYSGFIPDPQKCEEMDKFNEELGKAVKIISMDGLRPLTTGARVTFGTGKPAVTDGLSIEAKEVVGGYWRVEAESKEKLVKWAQRCPGIRATRLKSGRFGSHEIILAPTRFLNRRYKSQAKDRPSLDSPVSGWLNLTCLETFRQNRK
ncbi:MAG: YciI family protein [Terrimicrobiaceae bacterium]|nr:YciI family protein [Terrimicrobiaceae bacterium]